VVEAKKQVLALYKEICDKARAQDTILIYVTTHGTENGAFTLQAGPVVEGTDTPTEYIFPYFDLNTSLCAACHVIFIMDTCYSGVQLLDMSVKSPPHAGQKLTFITAANSVETSGGITDSWVNFFTGRVAGGVFTNAFLESLKEFSTANGGATQSNLQKIFDDAVVKMDSEIQHPLTVFKWDGAVCGAAPTLVTVTPTAVVEKHTVGSTSCPQTLPTITVKNVSEFTVSYSASSGSSYFNLASSSGTLAPGQSKSLGLSFNCGKVPPLSTSISLSASYSSFNQSVSIPITLNSGP
jgi:Caspase domain